MSLPTPGFGSHSTPDGPGGSLSDFDWGELEEETPRRPSGLPSVSEAAPSTERTPVSPALPTPAPLPSFERLEETDLGDFEDSGLSFDGPVLPPSADDVGVEVIEDDASSHISIDDLLNAMLDMKGSDLHLSPNAFPMARVRGDMTPIEGYARLTADQIAQAINSIMTEAQRKTFDENWELDFAYDLGGRSRFRVNVMKQKRSISVVMRAIPWEILPIEALQLPPVLNKFATLPRGLVLVTGPTGSGKSTTLAAIIDKANRTRAGHIVTIEDPVEFVHEHQRCVVNQREVGEDTKSFAAALKHVLRQDPDIILVGELRDLETISVALTAAETGHLVFGTLHTQSAAETLSRIIDVFPEGAKAQVRTQLAATIQGIVCQTLIKTADGAGRVAAVEILLGTPAVRALIREGKEHQMTTALQAGVKEEMQTLDMHLESLIRAGKITFEEAIEKAQDPVYLKESLGGDEGLRRLARQRENQNWSLQG